MRDDTIKYRTFTRRSLVLGGMKAALISLIAGRYYYLQVTKSDKYKTLSDQNRVKVIILPALRGVLRDRNDVEIANNTVFHRLIIENQNVRHYREILPKVEKILARPLKLSDEEIQKRITKKAKTEPLIIEDNLTWEEVSKISLNNFFLNDVEIIEAPVRSYLHGETFSQITGYIGSPTEDEVEDLNLPVFNELRIGKGGLEKVYDEDLRGYPGVKRTEVDVRGRLVRDISEDPQSPGKGMKLSLDAELQKFVYDIMQENNTKGAVVVMRAKTGEVLAMHSAPAFDPNEFVDGVSKAYWQKINSDKDNPLINNIVATPYPPGSTFKIITALAGLSAGVPPSKNVNCAGVYYLGSHPFRCWKSGGHGTLDMCQAISQSCNCYFYTLGQAIGAQRIADTARMLGYGEKTQIELPYEHPGMIPDPEWKKLRYKADWFAGDTINTSIGQGYVLVTPIQMAVMTARMATGKRITPTLLYKEVAPEFENLPVDPKHFETIRKGMMMVTNTPGGTAYWHKMSDCGMTVGGKTGTAQVAALKYKHAAHKFMHHGLFTSMAPVEDPEYVISVVVEHGEAGAKTAAPLAKKIYMKLAGQKEDKLIDDLAQEDEVDVYEG